MRETIIIGVIILATIIGLLSECPASLCLPRLAPWQAPLS